MTRKKYMILAFISIVIMIVSIVILAISVNANHQLWLNEYNAQMARFGYYKEDIHVLNQYSKEVWIIVGITSGIFGIIIFGMGAILLLIEFISY